MTETIPAATKSKHSVPSLLAKLWAVLTQVQTGKHIEQAISTIAFVSFGALVIAFALVPFSEWIRRNGTQPVDLLLWSSAYRPGVLGTYD